MAEQEKQDHAALAARYRDAAAHDAWHERDSGGQPDDVDPTLSVTPEVPGVPMRDVAHPDPADGEDHDAPPSPEGPDHDALMRGLEPGETSMG